MKKAIVTFATGEYTELLDISRPSFENYAERHGYDYIEGLPDGDRNRPSSWWRIPALQEILPKYDAVLWLGCDVVIVRDDKDVADEIPTDAWQALTPHRAHDSMIPNCDVWWLTPAMLPTLGQAWTLTQYIHHPWWEQAAIMHLMGYDMAGTPIAQKRETELHDKTHFLPLEWNSHESTDRHPNPRFAHATHGAFAWRKAIMQQYARRAA